MSIPLLMEPAAVPRSPDQAYSQAGRGADPAPADVYRSPKHNEQEDSIRSSAIAVSLLTALVICLALPSQLAAQEWSAEQQEVWTVVLASWEADKSKDLGWVDTYMHPNALGWGSGGYPMPMSRDALRERYRFVYENSTTLVQGLDPVGIVVEGSTAFVLYYYRQHVEDREGKRDDSYGQCAETWTRQSDTWLLLGWLCRHLPQQ